MFEVKPVDGSGGHSHTEGRETYVGTLSRYSVLFPAGTPAGSIESVKYTSGEVAGTEIISVAIAGSQEKPEEFPIDVKVPGLVPLSVGAFRLTGQTNAHLNNHYGASNTIEKTKLIAEDFYNEFHATLGINDMSLPWGGMFDIGPPQGSFWSPPHKSHRKGTSVDIDRNALGPNGWIKVDKPKIKEICINHGGFPAEEATIHCEFAR